MANSPWVELGVLTHQLRNTQELCLVHTIDALGKEAHIFIVPINDPQDSLFLDLWCFSDFTCFNRESGNVQFETIL